MKKLKTIFLTLLMLFALSNLIGQSFSNQFIMNNITNQMAHSITNSGNGIYTIAGIDNIGNVFVTQFLSDNSVNWSRTYGSPTSNEIGIPVNIISVPNGYLLAFSSDQSNGYTMKILKLNLDGTINWQNEYQTNSNFVVSSPRSISLDTDNNYVISGSMATGAGADDAFIMKINSTTGNVIFSNGFGTVNNDHSFSAIRIPNTNDYIYAGSSENSDTKLIKRIRFINNTITVIWSRNHKINNANQAYVDLEIAPNGNIYALGFNSVSLTNFNINLNEINITDGSIIWSKNYERGGNDFSGDIKVLNNGDILMSGYTYSNATLNDLFMTRLNSSGQEIWTYLYGGVLNEEQHILAKNISIDELNDRIYLASNTLSFGNNDWDPMIIITDLNGSGCFQRLDSFMITDVTPIDTFFDNDLQLSITESNSNLLIGNFIFTQQNLPTLINVVATPSTTDLFCPSSSSFLSATASGGASPYTFSWTPSSGLDFPNSANTNVNYTIAGTINYFVMATDTNGCSGTDTVSVVNHPRLSIGHPISNSSTCGDCNGSFQFDLILGQNITANVSYTLTGPISLNGTWTTNTGVVLDNLCEGDYTIQIIDQNNCLTIQNFSITNNDSDCCFADNPAVFVNFSDLYGTTINQDVTLNGKYYVSEDITFDGQGNEIFIDITNCDLVFEDCVGLNFVNGAQIRANNSVFRTCSAEDAWSGLRFIDSESNVVNECTFKNANAALHFSENSTGKVNSSLFLNNHVGIRFMNVESNNYALSNNNFVVDDQKPSETGCFEQTNESYGIVIINTTLIGQISQNQFVNNCIETENQTVGIGIFGKSDASISENTFTDMIHAIEVVDVQSEDLRIENNEIETNKSIVENQAQIILDKSRNVSVSGNEIKTFSESKGSRFYGVYINSSNDISVNANQIEGFSDGIQSASSSNIKIYDNVILNALVNGIRSISDNNILIGCNTIKMNNYDLNNNGITLNLTSNFNVSSNCIFDANTAINLVGGRNTTMPAGTNTSIRNNYLYNYNQYGIRNRNYTSISLGTNISNGQNSFISNSSAVDVESNQVLTMFNNYGASLISFPNVQIASNLPYYSNASCGNQTPSFTPQNNLDLSLDCSNFEFLITSLPNKTGSKVIDIVRNLSAEYYNLVYTNNSNLANEFYNNVTNGEFLSENEKSLFKYEIYNINNELADALHHLNEVETDGLEFSDYKYLASLILKSKMNLIDLENISNVDLITLERIAQEDHRFDNMASSILISYHNKEKIKIKAFKNDEEFDSSNSIAIQTNEIYLTLYPNPTNDFITLSYNINEEGDKNINVYDITGKLVLSEIGNFVSGSKTIDVINLSKGMYNISIQTQSGLILNQKFVKL